MDIKMEDLSLHANSQCDEQDQFEQNDTPPQVTYEVNPEDHSLLLIPITCILIRPTSFQI